MQDETLEWYGDPKAKDNRINPRTLKGPNPVKDLFNFIAKLLAKCAALAKQALALLLAAIIGYTFATMTAKDPEWTKYLPSGNVEYYKAVMRICQDKTICPNGAKDAPTIKLSYPNAPKEEMTGQPTPGATQEDVSKQTEVLTLNLDNPNGPLASLPLNTGKQLISMLGNTIQKTQR